MPPNYADMAGKRFVYCIALLFCGVFYIAYGEWLSCLVLVTVLVLPWFSLLLSLPAIFRFRVSPSGSSTLEMGEAGELWLLGSCPFPMPPFRGKLRLKQIITGKNWYYQDQEDLPCDHCGAILVTVEAVRICDYLGLFAFPVRCTDTKTVLIRPRPVAAALNKDLQENIPQRWKPKFGGGYAENHELRLYRPGDSLNQIHWKLSAKTGSLMLREPMEPQWGLILLTLNHRGTAEEIDRKLGRLMWLGSRLLQKQVVFEVRALTGTGTLTFSIASETDLAKAVDTLLCQNAASEGDLNSQDFSASWHYHIGGEPDEA